MKSQSLNRRLILGLRLAASGQGADLAEQAGFDFVFLDGVGDDAIGHDPLSVAAFLMTKTRRIGLAASVSTDWAPFNVARALASFDNLSGGRAGWLPLPSTHPGDQEAARFAEHLDVVLKLFDSWDDDALVFDKAQAIFADREKVRRIRHAGAFFTVDGPLNTPRPPQGWPVLFQALNQATPITDVALVDLDRLASSARVRAPDELTRLIAVAPYDRTLQPATDFAAELANLFARGACDGFLLRPADPSADLAILVEQVAPRLRAHGLSAHPSEDGDFRKRLGLPRPPNRSWARPADSEGLGRDR